MENGWDCIVVGAGAAGLSAALVLGRARRRTLVVDAGSPSNRFAHGIGGFLGQDGRPPADFYADGRRELAAYPTVEVRSGSVVGGETVGGRGGEVVGGHGAAADGSVLDRDVADRSLGDDETPEVTGFVLILDDGTRETARRVVLATGMDYRLPELPGVEERWGRSVFHCPFCHGWEVRERPLGVLDRGPSGVHRALLLSAWSDDVTLFADGPAELDPEDAERLRAARVTIDERPVSGLRGNGEPDSLEEVVFADGDTRACGGLLVPVSLHQRSGLARQLGVVAAEPGPVAFDALGVDAQFQTNVPGVFAAGDLSAQMPSVASSVAAGSFAAAMVVGSLTVEGSR